MTKYTEKEVRESAEWHRRDGLPSAGMLNAYADLLAGFGVIADLIQYPGEWDTTAYPTSADALNEFVSSAQVTEKLYQELRAKELAAQPVAVPDGYIQVKAEELQRIATHAKIAADNIVEYSKAGHTMYGWLDDACTHADIAAKNASSMLAAAPSPAAEHAQSAEVLSYEQFSAARDVFEHWFCEELGLDVDSNESESVIRRMLSAAALAQQQGRDAEPAEVLSDDRRMAGLSDEQMAFLRLVCAMPGYKLNGGEARSKDGAPLWEELERRGLIEAVGSYKWRNLTTPEALKDIRIAKLETALAEARAVLAQQQGQAEWMDCRVISCRPGMGEVTFYVSGGVPEFMDVGNVIRVAPSIAAIAAARGE